MGIQCSGTSSNNQPLLIDSAYNEACKLIQKDLPQLKSQDQQKTKFYRGVLTKIIMYKHRNLIKHVKNNQNNQQKIKQFLKQWSMLNYEQSDMKSIEKVIERRRVSRTTTVASCHCFNYLKYQNEQKFKKVNKFFSSIKQKVMYSYNSKKVFVLCYVCLVALFIFIQEETLLDKKEEFFKQSPKRYDAPLAKFKKIAMNIHKNHKKHTFPAIFVYADTYIFQQVNTFILQNNLTYLNIKILLTKSKPVLDQSGQYTIISQQFGGLVQRPQGNQEFLTEHYKGQSVSKLLEKSGTQFSIVLTCNYFENDLIVDPFMIGYLDQHEESLDVLYLCFDGLKEQIKKIGFPRVTTSSINAGAGGGQIQIHRYNTFYDVQQQQNKHTQQQNQLLLNFYNFPIWGNYFCFRNKSFYRGKNVSYTSTSTSQPIQHFNKQSNIITSQCLQIKKRLIKYWDPISKNYQQEGKCYIIQKPLTNFFANNKLKTLGLMIDFPYSSFQQWLSICQPSDLI